MYIMIGNQGACFPAGTLIRMADGSEKKIEEISLLDEVVTAESNTGRVLQLMTRKDEELYDIKLRGLNGFKCTPEHPILTNNGYVIAKIWQSGIKFV